MLYRCSLAMVLAIFAGTLSAQQAEYTLAAPDGTTAVPSQSDSNAPKPSAAPVQSSSASQLPEVPAPQAGVPVSKQQPKRILGLMPNYRAVSAGAIPPPPKPKRAFVIATQNSFDYSSFVFVGITSLFAEGSNSHPHLGKGVPGYWGYYWRGWVDKTDGNYMVVWALPSITHEDERYFARGEGSILGRALYASSRILITPDYNHHNTLNISELGGRAIAQAVSTTYYPSSDRTPGALAVRFGWAMGRDALTNTFREFWPDIATHALHRHP